MAYTHWRIPASSSWVSLPEDFIWPKWHSLSIQGYQKYWKANTPRSNSQTMRAGSWWTNTPTSLPSCWDSSELWFVQSLRKHSSGLSPFANNSNLLINTPSFSCFLLVLPGITFQINHLHLNPNLWVYSWGNTNTRADVFKIVVYDLKMCPLFYKHALSIILFPEGRK